MCVCVCVLFCFDFLILMLWHGQAIFESKGDNLSSSAECWIRSWEVRNTKSPADWMPTHKPTKLSKIKKNLELIARPYDERAFSPLDFIGDWFVHLSLAIYMLGLIELNCPMSKHSKCREIRWHPVSHFNYVIWKLHKITDSAVNCKHNLLVGLLLIMFSRSNVLNILFYADFIIKLLVNQLMCVRWETHVMWTMWPNTLAVISINGDHLFCVVWFSSTLAILLLSSLP